MIKQIYDYVKARYITPHLSEKGQSIVEYGLLLAFVVAAVVAVVGGDGGDGDLKTGLSGVFQKGTNALQSAAGSGGD